MVSASDLIELPAVANSRMMQKGVLKSNDRSISRKPILEYTARVMWPTLLLWMEDPLS